VRSISCRATRCRVELRHSTEESGKALEESLASNPALAGMQLTYYWQDREGLEQIVYVRQLPNPPPQSAPPADH
jgi:hypothetical protein